MNILVMMDTFKGSLGSLEAGAIVRDVLLNSWAAAEISVLPIADGGEGTLSVFQELGGGTLETCRVQDPLGRLIEASYLLNGKSAIIEMATASGLSALTIKERNPFMATSHGTGQMIRHAMSLGVRDFIVTIGGSATNDLGFGMLQALGAVFYDSQSPIARITPSVFQTLVAIDFKPLEALLEGCQFEVLCDVQNPLLGDQGATNIFAPQKGATSQDLPQLEAGMEVAARFVDAYAGEAVSRRPGAGAAGGMGAALSGILKARLKPGIEVILNHPSFQDRLRTCDFIITGEGRLDHQTLSGKVVLGIAAQAKKLNKPVLVIAGSLQDQPLALYDLGVSAMMSTIQKATDSEEAMAHARENLKNCVYQTVQLLRLGSRLGPLMNSADAASDRGELGREKPQRE